MLVHISTATPPFKGIDPAMQERHYQNLESQLAESGVAITAAEGSVMRLNLRNLLQRNSTQQQAWSALYSILESLHCVRVDMEAMDAAYLLGPGFDAQAIARGIESAVAGVVRLVTHVAPEDFFTGLDNALTFAYNDRLPDEQQAVLNNAAVDDMFFNGMMTQQEREAHYARHAPDNHDPFADVVKRTPEYDGAHVAYRSPFDQDGEL